MISTPRLHRLDAPIRKPKKRSKLWLEDAQNRNTSWASLGVKLQSQAHQTKKHMR